MMFKTLYVFTRKRFLQCKVTQVKDFFAFYIVNLLANINSYFQTWLIVTQCAAQLWDLPTCNASFVIGLIYN